MKKNELIKRYTLFVISLFISALGVAITKKGELGVSPISSVANILSIRFTFLTMGNWLIIWNCVLIFGQILILRKNFKLIQLLQVPLSFLFGYFTDFGMWIVKVFPVDMYVLRIGYVVLGVVVLAFGVSLSFVANVIMNSGEAFVKAIADTTKREVGSVKIVFDISCVSLAIVMSLVLCDMRILGTREGTLIAAILTGTMVKIYLKYIRKPIDEFLKK